MSLLSKPNSIRFMRAEDETRTVFGDPVIVPTQLTEAQFDIAYDHICSAHYYAFLADLDHWIREFGDDNHFLNTYGPEEDNDAFHMGYCEWLEGDELVNFPDCQVDSIFHEAYQDCRDDEKRAQLDAELEKYVNN